MKVPGFSILLILLCGLFSCSEVVDNNKTNSGYQDGQNGDQNNLKLKFSGEMGNNLKLKLKAPFRSGANTNVTEVWAVPVPKGFEQGYVNYYTNRVIGTIDSNGVFSVETSSSYDWVLMLMDTTLSNTLDQVIGFISMPGNNSTLLKMPGGNITNEVRFGKINLTNDEAIGESNFTASGSFSLSTSQLDEVAKTSQILKLIKNIHANYNWTNNTWYVMTPYYSWIIPNGLATATNGESLNTNYTGFSIGCVCNDSAGVGNPANYTNGTSTMSLVLPGPMTSVTYGQTNTGVTIVSNDRFMVNLDATYGNTWVTPQANFIGLPISGTWYLKKNDSTVLAQIDLAGAPLLDSNGYPAIYVPSLHLTVDSNNQITEIQFKWYYYDGVSYTPANMGLVNQAYDISGLAVEVRMINNQRMMFNNLQSLFPSNNDWRLTPTSTIYLNNATNGVSAIDLWGHLYAATIAFTWKNE